MTIRELIEILQEYEHDSHDLFMDEKPVMSIAVLEQHGGVTIEFNTRAVE